MNGSNPTFTDKSAPTRRFKQVSLRSAILGVVLCAALTGCDINATTPAPSTSSRSAWSPPALDPTQTDVFERASGLGYAVTRADPATFPARPATPEAPVAPVAEGPPDSQAAVEAAVRHFFAARDYALQSGDGSALDRASSDWCFSCGLLTHEASALASAGGYSISSATTVTDIRILTNHNGDLSVAARVQQPVYDTYDPATGVHIRRPATDGDWDLKFVWGSVAFADTEDTSDTASPTNTASPADPPERWLVYSAAPRLY
ncbi:hypothetical protein JT358_03665 [Micrococcales bacterium 31B]|nr:hypothetical protein [Micrococcales bacterium 31B]